MELPHTKPQLRTVRKVAAIADGLRVPYLSLSLSPFLYISYAVSLFHLAVSFDVRVNEVYLAFFLSSNELLSLSLSLSLVLYWT